jgi:hypothetical protein
VIAEAGLAALWLGAALCALQLLLAVGSFREEATTLSSLIRPVAVAQAVLTAFAFALLIWLFVAFRWWRTRVRAPRLSATQARESRQRRERRDFFDDATDEETFWWERV